MLTITIPTYNRNETLLRNLALLLPQLTPECQLLIVDNCSPTPVEETLRELLANHPSVNCEFVRNVVNIGLSGNLLRCIELCQTPWVWILGDDDKPLPNAVATILETLKAHPECTVLNFAIDQMREKDWTTHGLEELAHTLDGSADLPWISSSVYRAHDFQAKLKFGYQFANTLVPHIAILLMALSEKGGCHLSQNRIIQSEVRDVEVNVAQQWSVIDLALGFPTLFDLPLKLSLREMLAEKLLLSNLRPGNGLRNVAFQLLLLAIKQRDHRNALYYFNQIRGRHAFGRTPKRSLETGIYWLMLRFPRLGARLYRLAKGRALNMASSEDRFERI